MKVKDRFKNFSISLLEELSENDSYWQGVKKFWESNKEKECDLLTPKQISWMVKIEEDLITEARRSFSYPVEK